MSEIESPTKPSALRHKDTAIFRAGVCEDCPVCRIVPLALIDVILCH